MISAVKSVLISALPRKTKTGPLASFLFVLLAIILLVGCNSVPEPLVLNGQTMGTTYQVKVFPGSVEVAEDLAEQIQGTLDRLDGMFTTYRPDSELMTLNRAEIGQYRAISDDMLHVLQVAREVFQVTGGAFDPTVGPLVNLWGFGPEFTGDVIPSDKQIALQLPRIGFDKLQLDNALKRARRTGDIELDLSAVAKGYAVDVIAELLDSAGQRNYLVEVGGELRLSGDKANGDPWRIAIESPTLGRRDIQQVLSPGDVGMATSGNYRNFFERDGKRYSHTIDPRTGYPVLHHVVSATVIAERTAYADAMATAMMVLGREDAMAVAEKNDLAVYLIVKEGDELKAYVSTAFSHYLSGE